MKCKCACVAALVCLGAIGCTDMSKMRLLAVGGIHVFDMQPTCRIMRAEPSDSLENLNWADTLAIEAKKEGTAEVECGAEKFDLESVLATRLDIEMTNGGDSKKIPVGESFKVQARFYDRHGRELEVGKFTRLEWVANDAFEIANDRSSGEFGFCDTCFGTQGLRVVKPGKGSIEARLGELRGTLTLVAGK